MRLVSLIALLLIQVITSLAQSSDVSLNDLKSPVFPASQIIGVETKSIARPTDRNALATSLLSGFNGGISPNLAIEVSPFWLKSHPDLTFQRYLNPSSIGDAIRQSFAFSVATDKLENTEEGRKMGLGFRTQLIPGKASKKAVKLISQLTLLNIKNLLLRQMRRDEKVDSLMSTSQKIFIDKILNSVLILAKDGKYSDPFLTKDDLILFLSNDANEYFETLFSQNPKLDDQTYSDYFMTLIDKTNSVDDVLDLQKELKSRVGLIVELSMAAGMSFPTNRFEDADFNKIGVWTTVSHRSENQKSDIMMLVRYAESFQDSLASNFDLGLSVSRNSKDFVFSLEGIFRAQRIFLPDFNMNNEPIRIIRQTTTYKVAANLDYKLSDTIVINMSLGKDFDGPFKNNISNSGNLLALFGFNFGLPINKSLPIVKPNE